MKRYIRCTLTADTDWLQAIKELNAEGVGRVTLNGDKTAYRYVSPDKDYYLFGYVKDLPTVVDEVCRKYSNPDVFDVLVAAAKDKFGAHHAFEVSDLRTQLAVKNTEYGFRTLSTDEGMSKAKLVYSIIVDMCEDNGIDVGRPSFNPNYGVIIKPKLHQVKLSGGYGGLGDYIVYDWRADRSKFLQMLKRNTSELIRSANLIDLIINDRTGSVTFYY